MLRTWLRHGVMESTISSPTLPVFMASPKRASVETARTMHSVAERTSGRSTLFFCCIDIVVGDKESGTDLPVSTATLITSEAPTSAPSIMAPSPSSAESQPPYNNASDALHTHAKRCLEYTGSAAVLLNCNF